MNRYVATVAIILLLLNFLLAFHAYENEPVSQVVYMPTNDKSTSASSITPTIPTIAVKLPDEKLFRDMIQSVLRDELKPYEHQVAQNGSGQKYTLPHSDVVENSPANTQALSEASTVVSTAIATGTWTQDDNAKLAMQSRQLTSNQRLKLLRDVLSAVNRQELRPEAPPIF